MTRSHTRTCSRARRTPLLAAVLALGLAVPAASAAPDALAATPTSDRDQASRPSTIRLPDGFPPEGVATRGRRAWFGSREDGDIYRVDLRTGRGRVITQGPGTPALGMKIDRGGRLFVAGGSGGDVRVVDARSGDSLAEVQLVPRDRTSFINDVVLTDHGAWLTDSENPFLYRVKVRTKRHFVAVSVAKLRLRGQWRQREGLNANGITTTPDGRALLVVSSANGRLYRIDPRSGRARKVDLGDSRLTNGDGLLREGRTLYAVQNQLNQVAVLRLARDGRRGRVTRTLTSDTFDIPTTVARSGRGLYLPNARFSTPPTPATEYTATRLQVPRRR